MHQWLRSVIPGLLVTWAACLSGCNDSDDHPASRTMAGAAGTGVASVGGGTQGSSAQQGGAQQGGAQQGGAQQGGAQQGGAAQQSGTQQTGGVTQQGGAATGGSATGGRSSRATGGVAAGGKAQGGATTGGATEGGTSSTIASQYIDAINAVRAAVTQPTNYSGTWVALPNVTWSEPIAASAQAWADNLAANNNCGLQHESQSTYGENLAAGSNLTAQQAVDMWASEKSKYTWSASYSMADFNAGSGHYTQLVWRKSTQVGCGSAKCGNTVVISCRFSPPGNYIGQAVY